MRNFMNIKGSVRVRPPLKSPRPAHAYVDVNKSLSVFISYTTNVYHNT